MAVQTTKRPACRRKQINETAIESADSWNWKQKVASGSKWLLRYLLFRPTTWHFLADHLPALVEKPEAVIRQVFAWITDLF